MKKGLNDDFMIFPLSFGLLACLIVWAFNMQDHRIVVLSGVGIGYLTAGYRAFRRGSIR